MGQKSYCDIFLLIKVLGHHFDTSIDLLLKQEGIDGEFSAGVLEKLIHGGSCIFSSLTAQDKMAIGSAYTALTDFKKNGEGILLDGLWAAMKEFGIPDKIMRMVQLCVCI